MFIDSHCHLDFPDFAAELDDVVARAAEAGVTRMITIGTRLSAIDGVLAIAERFDNIYCSVGIHPHDVENEADTSAARLIEYAKHPKVVGIGETGLDYYYEHSPRALQQTLFRRHIAAARVTELPLIVHTRDADADTAAILAEETGKGAFTGVLHCFSSGAELARAALDLGFYISLSGIVTFKNAADLREIVKDIPLNRILIETDAPYLAPMPNRGKRNEPAFVVHTAQKVAEIQAVSVSDLASATVANTLTLFNRIPAAAA